MRVSLLIKYATCWFLLLVYIKQQFFSYWFRVIWLSLCSLSPPEHRVLPFYQQPNFLLSPSLSPMGLPCYAKKRAFAIADESYESYDSSSHCFPPLRCYDSRVLLYLDLSASEFEDSWIIIHWISYFHCYRF
jgi:hypothetical protein